MKAVEANANKLQMVQQMRQLTNKKPNMMQKLSILRVWFEQKVRRNQTSLTIREVGELILTKGLASDIDSAIKIVQTQLDIPAEQGSGISLQLEEFNRIFLIAILKSSFMEKLAEIEEVAEGKDIPLNLKIQNYQRKHMFAGLRSQREGKVDAASLLKNQEEEETQGVPPGLTNKTLITP